MYDCLREETKGVAVGKLPLRVTTTGEKQRGTGNGGQFAHARAINPLDEKAGLQRAKPEASLWKV